MNADDYYLQGKAIIADPTKITVDGNDEARRCFERAIELDPGFSQAYAELSYVYVREYQNGWSLVRAERLARKALSIKNDFDGHWSLASVLWNQGRFEESFAEYDTADTLNPQDQDHIADMAEAMIYGGDPKRAIDAINTALQNNPKSPYWYSWNLGRAYYMAGRYEDAIRAIGNIATLPNDVFLVTAASKAQLGQLDAAKSDMKTFSDNDPDWSIAKSAEYFYGNDADRQHWVDGLRKAGLKEK